MAIDVLDQNGLREGRTVMDTGAAIGMATGADFEVEGAVYLVFFCAMDAG
jgi:hypothetical protein